MATFPLHEGRIAAERNLRSASKKAREWTAKRNELIREARSYNISLRVIGEQTGLSHTAIAKILAR